MYLKFNKFADFLKKYMKSNEGKPPPPSPECMEYVFNLQKVLCEKYSLYLVGDMIFDFEDRTKFTLDEFYAKIEDNDLISKATDMGACE